MSTPFKASYTGTIFGLIFALGFAALPLSEWVNEFADTTHLIAYELVWWLATLSLLLYVRKIEQRPLSSIGFQPISFRGLFISIAAAVVTILGLASVYLILFPAMGVSEEAAINPILQTPLWWRIISCWRAGVSEEVLFRGYSIERISELTGNKYIAALISLAIFTFEHVPAYGWGHIFIAGFGGLTLTALYLYKRSLWINIIAHFIIDLTAVLSMA